MRRATRAGVIVVAAILTAMAAAMAVPVLAQSEQPPRTAMATVTRQGYFTHQAGGVVPATLTNEFPPGVICIVVPQSCSSQVQPITGPLGNAIPDIVTPDRMGPQLVEPNTLPVALSGGKPRYTSYLRFDLPGDLPKDALVDRFELVLSESNLTFALESPAFRRAVLGALATYQTDNPQELVKVISDVAAGTSPLATTNITGIELCAVTKPWAEGPNQDAAQQPPRDCVFGANGVRDPATRSWTFDLSLLAQSWLDGSVANEGVYLGPIGAENLAFGDPDTSTNWQVSLVGSSTPDLPTRPRLRYAFSPGFGDDDAGAGLDELTEDLTLDEPIGDATTGNLDAFAGSVFDAAEGGGGFSEVTGGTASEAATGATDEGRLRGRLASGSRPRTPWWVWLVLPLMAALAVGFERALAVAPAAVGGGGRGALTNLMARNSGGR